MNNSPRPLDNLSKIHTTKLGEERVKKNLRLDIDNVVDWLIEKMKNPAATASLIGKNWYVDIDDIKITINARSFTIITARSRQSAS
jgi:hypothetical protein